MEVIKTNINGVLIIEPRIFKDDRGQVSDINQKIIRINDEWQDLIKGVAQKEN